jgi:hypothetical protein
VPESQSESLPSCSTLVEEEPSRPTQKADAAPGPPSSPLRLLSPSTPFNPALLAAQFTVGSVHADVTELKVSLVSA